jgi:hypothetical protein
MKNNSLWINRLTVLTLKSKIKGYIKAHKIFILTFSCTREVVVLENFTQSKVQLRLG